MVRSLVLRTIYPTLQEKFLPEVAPQIRRAAVANKLGSPKITLTSSLFSCTFIFTSESLFLTDGVKFISDVDNY
jgi:hypothetical protein